MPNTLTADLEATKAALDAGSTLRDIRDQQIALFRLFDSLAALEYASCNLMEDLTPGATAALRAWGQAQHHTLSERTTTPPGCPPLVMLVVDAGPVHLTVTRYERGVVS